MKNKPIMHTDIRHEHPVFKKTPKSWHPYILLARLDRPAGTWLLLLPCFWGITLGSGGIRLLTFSFWELLFLFASGAALMRSAGCIINDMWDRDLDGAVTRTAQRPLASGAITMKQAWIFLTGLLLPALVILLCLNKTAIIWGLAAVPLVIAYPLMKRITWWPQAFLGLTFNWGIFVGYAAAKGSFDLSSTLLYLAGICWTIGYDTVYAHQDKEDDARIGIKSTARLFGDNSKTYVCAFYAAALLLAMIAKYMIAPSIGTPFFLIFPSVYIYRRLKNWAPNNADSSLQLFKSNAVFGALILLMLGF
ncbi:MAG: 4-hydroxybenzoate octaprenyltransferase [Alphaproteobacteria bacterium]|nr:4-hydroxybenzoate octaprenyltransferase [Alphaproteobacteria bacterium]